MFTFPLIAPIIGSALIGGISSLLGIGAGAAAQRLANKRLTGKEREQNEFNALEAEKAREFNAAEAEKARNFQAVQSATQYQRGVEDMQAAGLNPALAYGQGGASAMQGASASGPAASGSAQLVGLSDIVEVAKLKKDLELADAEIANKKKDIEVKDASIQGTNVNTELTKKQVLAFDPLNEATLDNLKADLNNKEVRARLDEQGISESKAREALDINNAILASMDADTRQQLNNLNVRLRVAEIGEAEGRINRISAEITELYSRAALNVANSGYLDQAVKNLCVENRILKYDADSKRFQVDHQNADRNWRIAGQVIQSVTGVAGVAVGAYTGAGMLKNSVANTSINQARLDWQQEMANYRSSPISGFR